MTKNQVDNKRLAATASLLKLLYRDWTPHPKQAKILKDVFYNKKSTVYAECGRKFGKFLSLDTPIPTPDRGLVPLRYIVDGDKIFGIDGKVYDVIGTSEVKSSLPCVRVKFSDGTEVVTSECHLWETWDKAARKSYSRAKNPAKHPDFRRSIDLKETIKSGEEWNHSIPCANYLQYNNEKSYLITPYVMGVWLGDGKAKGGSITNHPNDHEIVQNIERYGYTCSRSKNDLNYVGILDLEWRLKEIGVWGNKHIHHVYLTGNYGERLDLVRGLMDTDGYVSKRGHCFFYSTTKKLAEGFRTLLGSLGEQSKLRIKKTTHRDCYVVAFTPKNINPFYLNRKRQRVRDRKKPNHRFIVSVEPTLSVPVKCIGTNAPRNLFLITDQCIATHNTELIMAVLVRYAATHSNAGCYYIAPEQKQAKEILWATGRIQRFIPPELILRINNSEMRINFHNGSFIKLDGSDNHESYRGIEPHCLVYDEYKDHHPLFHIAMDPNRGVYNAPLVIIGTPPEAENHASEMKNLVIRMPNMAYHNYDSYSNPHIDHAWLDAKKEELLAKGEEDVWYREYMAKFVRGGKNSVFPNIDEKAHFASHDSILREIERDKHKLEWYTTADPGTASCFAVLFCALNPYTKKWYILDEIYEQDQRETSTANIIPRIDQIQAQLFYNADWIYTYDEAAAWFENEAAAISKSPWCPTQKNLMKPDPETKAPWGVSIIKDMFYRGNIVISDRCAKLKWEMLNYVRVPNREGVYKIPKKNDHLIDAFRYTIQAANYEIPEEKEPIKATNLRPLSKRRAYTITDDIRAETFDEEFDWGI